MSTVNQLISENIKTFITDISTNYNIDESKLYELLNKNNDKESLNEKELNKLKKPELVQMCRDKKLKVTGTKKDLIGRLLGNSNNTPNNTPASTPTSTPTKSKTKSPSVLSKVQSPQINITKNKHGNYEHIKTSFVFDINTKEVIGKQHDSGNIEKLSLNDIDTCNKYKFKYNSSLINMVDENEDKELENLSDDTDSEIELSDEEKVSKDKEEEEDEEDEEIELEEELLLESSDDEDISD